MFTHTLKRFRSTAPFNFVPKHQPASEKDIRLLKNFIFESNKIVIITGAGISTESGIPDYRSEEVGLYARSNHKPVQYLEFLKSEKTRQRYWARNYVGWERFSKREPNETHYAIRDLENCKNVLSTVTQNVDSLHFKAGSKNIIELHGSAFRVLCLNCNKLYDRHYIQQILKKLNPHLTETSNFVRPDGDVELLQEKVDNFNPPSCECCGGILKPDIVFFGDNVPKIRVQLIDKFVSECDTVLVLGSSLSVYSAYRFVLQGAEENKRIGIVNIGPTRGDKYAQLKISAKCSDVLNGLR